MIRLIRKYDNRKLYDNMESKYITLAELAKVIRNSDGNIQVVYQKTKEDITYETLMQVLFDQQKKDTGDKKDIALLNKIIRQGTLIDYIKKLEEDSQGLPKQM